MNISQIMKYVNGYKEITFPKPTQVFQSTKHKTIPDSKCYSVAAGVSSMTSLFHKFQEVITYISLFSSQLVYNLTHFSLFVCKVDFFQVDSGSCWLMVDKGGNKFWILSNQDILEEPILEMYRRNYFMFSVGFWNILVIECIVASMKFDYI